MLKTSEIEKILSYANMPKLENILTPHLITKVNTIYRIGCKCSDKCYIGQTSKMTIERWQEHISMLRNGTHHSTGLQNAYNKYGEDSFTFEVIECTLKAFLNDKEIYWIDYYDSYYNGYNETLGGDSNPMLNPEVAEKFYKPVYQYNLEGELVKTYKSTKFVKEGGYTPGNVGNACNNNRGTCIYKDYVWSYEPLTKEQVLKIVSEYEENLKRPYQYNKSGELVRTYTNCVECEKYGFNRYLVGDACRNKHNDSNIYKGFIWSYKPLTIDEIKEYIKRDTHNKNLRHEKYLETIKSDQYRSKKSALSKRVWSNLDLRAKVSKKVYQYEFSGKLVRTYTCVKDCIKYNFSKTLVCDACNNKYNGLGNIYKGFIWSYTPLTIDEVEKNIKQFREHQKIKRENYSKANKGGKNPGARKVYQYTQDYKLVRIYESVSTCEEYGFSQVIISSACRNKYYGKNVYKNFIWSYIPLTANEEEA